MDKKERVDEVLAGHAVDRAPFTFWYHFGDQFLPGKIHAQNSLQFFNYFNLDILKLMNDYHLQVPAGLKSVNSAEDLLRIEHIDPEKTLLREQLEAVKFLNSELGSTAYLIDTVFDPWQQLTKHIVAEHIHDVVEKHPIELKRALDVMADNVIEYSVRSLSRGAAGIFLAIQASDNLVRGEDLFEEFIVPPAMKVLSAIEDLGKLNTLHLCGSEIYTGHVSEYPVKVLSWADRLPANPSISAMRDLFDGVIMGGIDHTKLNRYSWESIQDNVQTGAKLGGKERFILAPGCSTPAEMDAEIFTKMAVCAQS